MGRKWRQRPIACQSCRRRKIRCSREFPCSNCTSRGIKCVQFYESQEPRQVDTLAVAGNAPDVVMQQMKLQQLLPVSSPSRDVSEPISVLFPNTDIRARLDRLENWITSLNGPSGGAAPSMSRNTIEKSDGALQHQPVGQQFFSETLIRQLSPPQISTLKQITADAVWAGGNLMFNKPQIMLTSSSPAQTILMKVSCYMEGSSVRNRSLVSTSIAMAREMGIHRIDLPGEQRSGTNSPIEIEIARRVWWDNVTVDWFLALFPGPQVGVYTIHPQHMAVNKPSNAAADFGEDCQLLSTNGRTRTEQADVSYFVGRIQLAEVGREYVDSCPISQPCSSEHKQEKLREYNAKLDEFQRNLPSHLSLRRPGDLRESSGPQIPAHVHQCLHINFLIYIERCIVNLRFLPFANVDERFSFSYQVCFECAREIIWMFKVIKTDHSWIIPRIKSTSALRALLLACAIFLLDICSGVEIHDLQSQRPEMIEAWQLLGETEEDSNLVDQFLDFASQMLNKYRIHESIIAKLEAAIFSPGSSSGSHVSPTLHQQHQYQQQDDRQCPCVVSNQQYQTNMGPAHVEAPMNESGQPSTSPQGVPPMDLTQRWQTLDTDFDITTMSWDNVLWGFDTVLM
ncbi:hypothetical protein E4U21_003195 [Claviceps maximensis]|nr:hypothetical protein E4U21_003195 [Claviceps maximensis]